MNKVFLALGSNLDDRLVYIKSAISEIKKLGKVKKVSSIYETEPWGETDQPSFLNCVLELTCELNARELLSSLKDLEKRVGRIDRGKWQRREIDIDIIYFNDQIINEPGLIVPHPHISERAFVLVPLAEIAPDSVHPKLNKSSKELAAKVDLEGIKKYAEL